MPSQNPRIRQNWEKWGNICIFDLDDWKSNRIWFIPSHILSIWSDNSVSQAVWILMTKFNHMIIIVMITIKVPGGKRRIAEGRRVASKKGRYTEVWNCFTRRYTRKIHWGIPCKLEVKPLQTSSMLLKREDTLRYVVALAFAFAGFVISLAWRAGCKPEV